MAYCGIIRILVSVSTICVLCYAQSEYLVKIGEPDKANIQRNDLIADTKRRPCPKLCICQDRTAYCDAMLIMHMPRHFSPQIETINIRDNEIRRIKYHKLQGLYNLRHLLMKGNKISYIEPGAFRDQGRLTALSLTHNRLRSLDPAVFEGLVSLQVFSARQNMIEDIEGVFSNLTQLQLINMGNNRLRRLTGHTFSHNKELRVLDLHNNSLRHIAKDTFTKLVHLKYLVLRDNPIKTMAMDFRPNMHLELLDFTNCQLQHIIRWLPHSINDLRMSENNIRVVRENDFRATKKIRLLVLNNNNIEKVHPRAFSSMWQLYELYLTNNKLTELPPFMPVGIHGVFANFNNISKIPAKMLAKYTSLEFMKLRHNNIDVIEHNALEGLSELRSLDLSENDIHDIKPNTFKKTTKLQLLDLSKNPIEELEHDCFQGLSNLHILQLSSLISNSSRPRIRPSIFEDTRNLLFLDLSNSSQLVRHMAENPYVLHYLHSVEDLNLNDDDLYGLPPTFPNHFPYLKIIKLIGNPWHCDHSIYWLTQWMRNRSVEFYAPNRMVCASPPEMKGRLIAEIYEDELPTVPPPRPQTPTFPLVDIPFTYGPHNSNNASSDWKFITPNATSSNQIEPTTEPHFLFTTMTPEEWKKFKKEYYRKHKKMEHPGPEPNAAPTERWRDLITRYGKQMSTTEAPIETESANFTELEQEAFMLNTTTAEMQIIPQSTTQTSTSTDSTTTTTSTVNATTVTATTPTAKVEQPAIKVTQFMIPTPETTEPAVRPKNWYYSLYKGKQTELEKYLKLKKGQQPAAVNKIGKGQQSPQQDQLPIKARWPGGSGQHTQRGLSMPDFGAYPTRPKHRDPGKNPEPGPMRLDMMEVVQKVIQQHQKQLEQYEEHKEQLEQQLRNYGPYDNTGNHGNGVHGNHGNGVGGNSADSYTSLIRHHAHRDRNPELRHDSHQPMIHAQDTEHQILQQTVGEKSGQPVLIDDSADFESGDEHVVV